MTKFKPGLGKGLGALINPNFSNNEQSLTLSSSDLKEDDGKSNNIIVSLNVGSISPNPYQPRKEFNKEALNELKKSILENGLIQPITVRRSYENHFELISGERRLRACTEIGLKTIPAYIIKVTTKEAMVALSLIENIQREDLNPIEIADSYKRLVEECSMSQDEIAEKVGKNRTTITNSLRLLKLPKDVQNCLINGEITTGHARALINIPVLSTQLEILNQILKNKLSVRNVEALVKKLSKVNTAVSVHVSKNKNDENLENISLRDLEDKLRRVFGTKVECKQRKDETGSISIEYYSSDELDRLLDLFEIIEKYN